MSILVLINIALHGVDILKCRGTGVLKLLQCTGGVKGALGGNRGYCGVLKLLWVLGVLRCTKGTGGYCGEIVGTVGYCGVLWVTMGYCRYWGYWVILGG